MIADSDPIRNDFFLKTSKYALPAKIEEKRSFQKVVRLSHKLENQIFSTASTNH